MNVAIRKSIRRVIYLVLVGNYLSWATLHLATLSKTRPSYSTIRKIVQCSANYLPI